MANLDFTRTRVLTFDCYGTLIDWEQGILASLRYFLLKGAASDDSLLEEYAALEANAEASTYRSYREILGESLSAITLAHGESVTDDQRAELGGSVVDWPAFPDAADALRRLATRFDLGVITNCDDDLFAASNARLGEPFKWIVTAQQARSYKPSTNNFEIAFERIGAPREQIVHVAQSLFHDHVPAKQLGLNTVWINRRAGRSGAGATTPASATPDLTFVDMASFTDFCLAENHE